MSRNPVRLLVLSILILSVFAFPQMIQPARAQLIGVVCIGPDLPGQTACPATPVVLSGPLTTGPSTQIRFQVFIQGTDPMNGFDITLLAPHAVLVPVGIDLSGNVLPGGTVLLECIQGVLVSGSVCQASDTLDTLHLAEAGAPGFITTAGTSGLLFTAIYNIVGASAGLTIGFQNNANDGLTNCATTSVPGTCISISNGTTTPVRETVQTGSFSSSSTQPAIQLSPNSASLGQVFRTQPISQSVTATDVGGAYALTGQTDASLTYTTSIVGPSPSATGVSASISPATFDFNLSPGPNVATLSITSAGTATLGTWSVSVTGLYHFDPTCAGPGTCTGTESTLLETVTYTFTLVDFGFTASPAVVPFWCPATAQGSACPAGQSGSSTLTVTPQGFTGTVTISTLSITPATPALTVVYGTTSIPGASGTSTATFSLGALRPSATQGAYSVTTRAQGTLGTFTRSVNVVFNVRPQDFNVTTSNGTPTGPSKTFASGSSTTDTLTIGSLPSGSTAVNIAGFAGPVTLSSAITGGTGLTVAFATNPVTLTAGQKLTDLVTFSGTVSTTTTFSVTITGTATLATSTPSTQTHSVTYSVTITVAGPPPDFTVTANPTAVSVVAGATATSTITVAPTNGFTGTVALTSTVSPAGLTCTLNPTSIVLGASQTSTLSCSGSAGTYTVTVTGTSGTLSHSATVTVTVTVPPDYTVVANPTTTTILAGATATSTITVAPVNGFTGTVALTSTVSPAGLTCTLSPPSVVLGAAQTSTLSCTGTTATTFTVIVTGASGTLSHSATVTVTVQDFTIAASPTSFTFTSPGSGTSTITVTALNGFNGIVSLSSTVSPATGLTCTLSLTSVTGSGTSTLSCSSSTPGTYTVTVTGTSGTLSHPAIVTVTVTAPQDFSVTANPTTATVLAGATATSTITVAPINGFTGTVTLSSAVSPTTGLTCSLSATSIAGGSGTSTLSCSGSAGTHTVTVTGTSGTLSHSATVTVTVQDFTIAASPTSFIFASGSSGSSTISVTAVNGFSGVVSLTSSISPTTGLTCTLSPTSVTGSGTSTLSCSSSTLGAFTVTVTGTSGTLSHTASVTVTVVQPQDFIVTANPVSVTALAGTAGTSTITVAPMNGFTGTVSLTSTVSPATGLTCTLSPSSVVLGTSQTSTLSCSGSAGVYTVTVTGTSGATTHVATVTFTIRDFTVTASPTTVSGNAGTSITSTITVAPVNGFTGTVALTSTVSPAGLTCTLNPTSIVLGASQTSTLSCSGSAGTYTVTVTGTSGTLTHSATVTVTVTQLPTVTITTTLSATSISVGGSVTDSASLSGNTATAGGTVTYRFFTGSTCSGTGTVVGSPVTVTNGVVPNSASQAFNVAGSYSWNAVYSGDANDAPATSVCEPLMINRATPTITTTLSATQITVGGSVFDTATMTGGFQAGGSLGYNLFANGNCQPLSTLVSLVTVTNGAIPNSAPHVFNTAGSFSWNVSYSGDTNNNMATSACEPLTVSAPVLRTTTTTVTCVPASINFGSMTTCTALVNDTDTGTGIVPTGTVTFSSGDTGTFVGSPCTVSRPPGFVVPIATCQVTYTPTGTAARTDVITGSYSGDASHTTSSGQFSVNVAIVPLHPTTTTVSCVPNPVTIGQLSSCTAIVTDTFTTPTTPTGTVSFTPGGVCTLTSVSSSSAACSISLIPVASGTIAVSASYSGDSTHSISSGNTNLATSLRMPTVTVACVPPSVAVNQATTCTATVADQVAGTTSIPTGTVTFTPGGSCTLSHSSSDPNPESTCSVNITPTTTGQLLISAAYSGDGTHSSNQGSTTITVTPAVLHSTTTSVSCSPSTVNVGSPTTCKASVIDTSTTPTTPTGMVTFVSDSSGIFSGSGTCALLAGTVGSASCTVTYTPNSVGTGTHTISGSYSGDTTRAPSSGTFKLTVTQPSGQAVQLTFQAFDVDDFDNGVGQLQVFVNGHQVVDIPAGLNHLSGTGDYAPYMNKWVKFGPFDITSFLVQGQNTIVFMSPPPGHFGLVKNVTIVQGNVVLLHVMGARVVSLSHSVTFTFSVPPLLITSFTVSSSTPSNEQNVTFRATYTGGTAPFKCVFLFGDYEFASAIGTAGSCSVIHEYDCSGIFRARVVIIGSSTSDLVISSALQVTVTES